MKIEDLHPSSEIFLIKKSPLHLLVETQHSSIAIFIMLSHRSKLCTHKKLEKSSKLRGDNQRRIDDQELHYVKNTFSSWVLISSTACLTSFRITSYNTFPASSPIWCSYQITIYKAIANKLLLLALSSFDKKNEWRLWNHLVKTINCTGCLLILDIERMRTPRLIISKWRMALQKSW